VLTHNSDNCVIDNVLFCRPDRHLCSNHAKCATIHPFPRELLPQGATYPLTAANLLTAYNNTLLKDWRTLVHRKVQIYRQAQMQIRVDVPGMSQHSVSINMGQYVVVDESVVVQGRDVLQDGYLRIEFFFTHKDNNDVHTAWLCGSWMQDLSLQATRSMMPNHRLFVVGVTRSIQPVFAIRKLCHFQHACNYDDRLGRAPTGIPCAPSAGGVWTHDLHHNLYFLDPSFKQQS
jgi:hypothetical protein